MGVLVGKRQAVSHEVRKCHHTVHRCDHAQSHLSTVVTRRCALYVLLGDGLGQRRLGISAAAVAAPVVGIQLHAELPLMPRPEGTDMLMSRRPSDTD